MSEVNIDKDLVAQGGGYLERMKNLSNYQMGVSVVL